MLPESFWQIDFDVSGMIARRFDVSGIRWTLHIGFPHGYPRLNKSQWWRQWISDCQGPCSGLPDINRKRVEDMSIYANLSIWKRNNPDSFNWVYAAVRGMHATDKDHQHTAIGGLVAA